MRMTDRRALLELLVDCRFFPNRWLDKKEGDGLIELDLTPSEVTKKDSGAYDEEPADG